MTRRGGRLLSKPPTLGRQRRCIGCRHNRDTAHNNPRLPAPVCTTATCTTRYHARVADALADEGQGDDDSVSVLRFVASRRSFLVPRTMRETARPAFPGSLPHTCRIATTYAIYAHLITVAGAKPGRLGETAPDRHRVTLVLLRPDQSMLIIVKLLCQSPRPSSLRLDLHTIRTHSFRTPVAHMHCILGTCLPAETRSLAGNSEGPHTGVSVRRLPVPLTLWSRLRLREETAGMLGSETVAGFGRTLVCGLEDGLVDGGSEREVGQPFRRLLVSPTGLTRR